MNKDNELRFAINDRIEDVELSPARVPLALLGEFQRDVSDFLKGSSRDVDTTHVLVSIEEGSLALRAVGLLAATTLWLDLESLKFPDALSRIDKKRASVIERWQTLARLQPSRRYTVNNQDKKTIFTVNSTTNYDCAEDSWVNVEKYLYGKIVDWGGKTKANVHIELDTGGTEIVESSQILIAQEEHNLVYRQATLRVSAEENLETGGLRNLRLLAFEHHHPKYDDNEFKQMVERGTQAWEGVDNLWLESLRGNG